MPTTTEYPTDPDPTAEDWANWWAAYPAYIAAKAARGAYPMDPIRNARALCNTLLWIIGLHNLGCITPEQAYAWIAQIGFAVRLAPPPTHEWPLWGVDDGLIRAALGGGSVR